MANSIADSDSIGIEKILVPHSTAISILSYLLSNFEKKEFKWLDLACGKGQILIQLGDNLDGNYRNILNITLVDIDNNALREATKIADDLELKNYSQEVYYLNEYCTQKLKEEEFDFITLINSIHEIKPKEIATVLIKSIIGLKENGFFYLFDQEILPDKELELGAITWTSFEIVQMFNEFFKQCNFDYSITSNKWNHSKNTSWSVQINRNKINIDNKTLLDSIPKMENIIKGMLESKIDIVKKALLSTTNNGEKTELEDGNKIRNLYDFWAMNLALEDY